MFSVFTFGYDFNFFHHFISHIKIRKFRHCPKCFVVVRNRTAENKTSLPLGDSA